MNPDVAKPPLIAPAGLNWALATPLHHGATPFIAGRALASRLLTDAGARTTNVARGPRGEPVWPDGFTGSISHRDDDLLVCVAKTSALISVGCDVERICPWEPEAAAIAFTPVELIWLNQQPTAERDRRATLLFGQKEAALKCLSPLLGRIVDFRQLSVSVDIATLRWSATCALSGARPVGVSMLDEVRAVSLAWITAG